jgi:hypothetical protein
VVLVEMFSHQAFILKTCRLRFGNAIIADGTKACLTPGSGDAVIHGTIPKMGKGVAVSLLVKRLSRSSCPTSVALRCHCVMFNSDRSVR